MKFNPRKFEEIFMTRTKSDDHLKNENTIQYIIKLCTNKKINAYRHRIGKEQKAHSFDLFDAAATRRNARAPTAAMLLARSSQPDQ